MGRLLIGHPGRRERLERNRELARRNARPFHLLSGLGECGRRMVGVYKNRTGRRYYQCGHRGALTRVNGTEACYAPYVNADRLEAQVWEGITALLQDAALLEQELHRRRETGSPPSPPRWAGSLKVTARGSFRTS